MCACMRDCVCMHACLCVHPCVHAGACMCECMCAYFDNFTHSLHRTGPAGSAICIYAASASTNNRNQNRGLFDTFIDDITLAANPDRTVENRYSHCDGNGRPVTDGTTLGAADTVVSRTMIQLGVNPLIVFDSI